MLQRTSSHRRASSERFYQDLPVLTDFLEITEPANFCPAPSDWYVVVTDIVNSTQAIAAGHYKAVNLVGAAAIIALLNLAQEVEIPFVFGGDGASILIPPGLLPQSWQALLATQQLAAQKFGLQLRIGIVPIPDVVAGGYEVKIAKVRISQNYHQAIFVGGGLTYATDLVKADRNQERYQLNLSGITPRANFAGLECRWQDIPSLHGETISLLVMATPGNLARSNPIYREVLTQIRAIYGHEPQHQPVQPETLRLSFRHRNLMGETCIRATNSHWLGQMAYLMQIRLENLLGLLFMRYGLTIGGMDWSQYRPIVCAASDYRKFDDMLRMVIAGNTRQRLQLTAYLERKFRQGELTYGLHVSDRALMTCIVFDRNGRQVHFIDGADGGYALAARAMKQRQRI